MTTAQGETLAIMFLVGLIGLFALGFGDKKWHYIAGGLWIAMWCGPALIALWLKGVLG